MRRRSQLAILSLVLVAGAVAAADSDASSSVDHPQLYTPVASSSSSAQPGNPFKNRLRQLFRQPSGRLSLLSFLEGLLAGSNAKPSAKAQAVPATAASQTSAVAASDNATAAAAATAAAIATSAGRDWPLTDQEIDAINKMFGGPSGNQGPYQYNTGAPPLQQLLSLNITTAAQLAKTLSGDRLEKLAASPDSCGYIARTFVVSGDALLKLHLTADLQLVIRDIISDQLEAATTVSSDQVLTFASSNVSISLGFKGVAFQDVSPLATPEGHQGLAAVRDALSQLAGGFDPKHIAVSFSALPAPSESAAAATMQQGRRLLGAPQQEQDADTPVTVYARFYNVDPANATSVTGALGKMCNSATATFNASATWASLAADTQVSPICASVFTAEFAQHGVPLSFGKLSVTTVGKPQASVALSVAVGLTPDQTVNATLVNTASRWLNSTALPDILHDLDLTAKTFPTDFLSYLEHGQDTPESSSLVSRANLPGLITSILGAPASDKHQLTAGAAGAAVSKGMIAGITIATVTSVLALVGVGVLLMARKRPAADKEDDKDALPTTHTDGARRKKRRPRLYHSKYMTSAGPGGAGSSAAPQTAGTDAEGLNQSLELAPRPALERGDSVTSAVKFEVDEATGEGDEESPDQDHQAQSGSRRSSTSSSCSYDSIGVEQYAGCSSSMQPQQHQQQPVHVPGCYHGSGAASAYSLEQGRPASETSSISGSCSDIPWRTVVLSQQACGITEQQVCSPSQRLPTIYSQEQHYFCPETGAADAAAMFSAMEDHMATSARSVGGRHNSTSSTSSAGLTVQPLGLSCWHSSGHTSLASSLGSSLAGLQQEQLEQQQWRQTAASPFAAAASPFAAAAQEETVELQQQQQQRCSSSGMVSATPMEQYCGWQPPACTAAPSPFELAQGNPAQQ